MDIKAAAYDVGHNFKGGVFALAPRIGKNPNTFNAELASLGNAKLGLVDAVEMTVVTQDYRVLDTFAMRCGRMTVPLPELLDPEHSDDCMHALAQLTLEFGQLVAEVGASGADPTVSDNALQRMQGKSGRVVAAIHALLRAETARNSASRQGRGDRTSRLLAA